MRGASEDGLEGGVGVTEPQRSLSDGAHARAASSGWRWQGLLRLHSGVHSPGTEEAESPVGSSAQHVGQIPGSLGEEEDVVVRQLKGDGKKPRVVIGWRGGGVPPWVEWWWGGSGSLLPTPLPCSPGESAQLAAPGRDLRPVHTGGLAPTQEEPFVFKQVQFINNDRGTGTYLFMMAFKSPIRVTYTFLANLPKTC